MPHQCVKCGKIYGDGASEILRGCSDCTGKLFFYVKQERLEEAQEVFDFKLSDKDKDQIEKDVFEIIGAKRTEDQTVILDFESIKILRPGQYELDLVNLFQSKQPLIYKLEEGKYMVDLAESFKKLRKTKK